MSLMNFGHAELFAALILDFVTVNSANVTSWSWLFWHFLFLLTHPPVCSWCNRPIRRWLLLVCITQSISPLWNVFSLQLSPFIFLGFITTLFFIPVPLHFIWGYWFPLRLHHLELQDWVFHFCIFRDYLFQCCPPPSLLKNIKYYFQVALCLLEHYFP